MKTLHVQICGFLIYHWRLVYLYTQFAVYNILWLLYVCRFTLEYDINYILKNLERNSDWACIVNVVLELFTFGEINQNASAPIWIGP